MNYDEMKYIDTYIREALRRMYANTAPPPADFKERILGNAGSGTV